MNIFNRKRYRVNDLIYFTLGDVCDASSPILEGYIKAFVRVEGKNAYVTSIVEKGEYVLKFESDLFPSFIEAKKNRIEKIQNQLKNYSNTYLDMQIQYIKSDNSKEFIQEKNMNGIEEFLKKASELSQVLVIVRDWANSSNYLVQERARIEGHMIWNKAK